MVALITHRLKDLPVVKVAVKENELYFPATQYVVMVKLVGLLVSTDGGGSLHLNCLY